MTETVGIVGLGLMGGAIAVNLAAAGWRVIGLDLDPVRGAALASSGVAIAADLAALARSAPVILTSLPSGAAAVATAQAIATVCTERRIVIETSTLTLGDKVRIDAILAEAGHVALDCPLSGTGAQAVTRDLVVYASGDGAAIAACRPLFAGFAREAHDLGTFGNGSRMKFVANLLVAIHNVASAEAMVLATKAGLDPARVVDLVRSGVGNSRIFELRAPMMAANSYAPATMRVSTWAKDMAVTGEFAEGLGCPTPLFAATGPIYEAALAEGHADEDTASVCAVLERMAGLSRT